MKASITNTSRAPQGVHAVTGLVFIEPGQSRDVDVADDYVERVKALPFLDAQWGDAASDPLDHDAGGKKGGSAPNDSPTERDDLKAQAKELGIDHAKNISTEKLRELIDAKLAA